MKNWFKWWWCRLFHVGAHVQKIEWLGTGSVLCMRFTCRCGAAHHVYPVFLSDLPKELLEKNDARVVRGNFGKN